MPRAKPMAAFVGLPSASNAIFAAGRLILFHQRLGCVGHAIGHDDQTARAGVDFHGIERDARIGKRGGHHLLQLLVRGIKVERGNFLDADFERERVLSAMGYSLLLIGGRAIASSPSPTTLEI